VLAAWSFWIETLLRQTRKVAGEFWPDFPTMRGILQTLRELYLYMFPLDAWFSYLLGALLLLGLFALRRQPRLAIGMFVLAFAPPALVLLVSLLKPMFLTRIMLYAPVPCYALIAAGAFAVPLRPLPYVLAGAIMFAGHGALDKYYYGYTPKSPFRRIIRYLHEQYDPKTLIVTSGSQERTVLKYYWNRRSDPLPTFPVGGLHGRKGNRVLKQVRGYDTLWIVDYKKGVRYSTRIARRELDKRVKLVEQKQFGKVMLFRYDVRPQPKPARPPRTKTAPWPGPLPDPATVPWPGPVLDPRGSRP